MNRRNSYYSQIRKLNIPATTAKHLADGLDQNGGSMPVDLQQTARQSLEDAHQGGERHG